MSNISKMAACRIMSKELDKKCHDVRFYHQDGRVSSLPVRLSKCPPKIGWEDVWSEEDLNNMLDSAASYATHEQKQRPYLSQWMDVLETAKKHSEDVAIEPGWASASPASQLQYKCDKISDFLRSEVKSLSTWLDDLMNDKKYPFWKSRSIKKRLEEMKCSLEEGQLDYGGFIHPIVSFQDLQQYRLFILHYLDTLFS